MKYISYLASILLACSCSPPQGLTIKSNAIIQIAEPEDTNIYGILAGPKQIKPRRYIPECILKSHRITRWWEQKSEWSDDPSMQEETLSLSAAGSYISVSTTLLTYKLPTDEQTISLDIKFNPVYTESSIFFLELGRYRWELRTTGMIFFIDNELWAEAAINPAVADYTERTTVGFTISNNKIIFDVPGSILTWPVELDGVSQENTFLTLGTRKESPEALTSNVIIFSLYIDRAVSVNCK